MKVFQLIGLKKFQKQKGNLCDCDNWRGICVLPMVAKINSKIISQRLKQYLYSTIDAEQAGFRPGLSCTISTRLAS